MTLGKTHVWCKSNTRKPSITHQEENDMILWINGNDIDYAIASY